MKSIFKIIAILAVAVLVGGVFYGAVTATSSDSGSSSMPERPADGQFPEGQFAPPERGETGGAQLPVEMIKSFAIMSVFAALYFGFTRFFGRKRIFSQPA